MKKKFDLVIIGSGPGGYVAAIRAAQLGMSVCLLENNHLGGVCLNWGCIPTKSLLKSAHSFEAVKNARVFGVIADNFRLDYPLARERKNEVVKQLVKGVEFILQKRAVSMVYGQASFETKNSLRVNNEEIEFENCIIATGSRPRDLPQIKFNPAVGIISSTECLDLEQVPDRVVIIGAGVIGCEFADMFSGFGAQVSLVDIAEQILPMEDKDVVQPLVAHFRKKNIALHLKNSVESVAVDTDKKLKVNLRSGEPIFAEKVLLSVGRLPNLDGLGLDKAGVLHSQNGVTVDSRMRTNIRNIYAIGDVAGRSFLAHTASREGIIAAENISGVSREMDYAVVPRCVYTDPEIGSVGITEAEALKRGGEIKIGKFPMRACGRAMVENQTAGQVKIITDAATKKILGAAVCGIQAAELIHELALAMSAGLTYEKIVGLIHAHPTVSETILEAAENIDQQSIHII